jgi:glycosyltransferase involved in cell wall biosynthesis
MPVEVCAFWLTGSPVEQIWLQRLKAGGLAVWSAAKWQGRGIGGFAAYQAGLSVLAEHCRSSNYDMLHSHFQLGSLAGLALRRVGMVHAAVRTAHITLEWGQGGVNRLLRTVSDVLYPLLLDGEAGVSPAICRRLDRRLAARLLRKTSRYIPNAIHLPVQTVSKGYRSPPPLLLGALGRLEHQKGFDFLLEAFNRLNQQGEDVRLVIAGEGREQRSLEAQIAAEPWSERVSLAGSIADGPGFIQGLDLLVLPSRYEGLPTVLLEAMALGVPVAAFRIPGIQEVVDENSAWLADAADSTGLAEQIQHALHNPVESARRAANAAKLVQKYDLAAIAEEYEQFYRG